MYTTSQVSELIDHYLAKGGDITEIESGVLGYGTLILSGKGLKYAIVTEVYLNEWSSGHKIRLWNKLPKKYKYLTEKQSNSLTIKINNNGPD